MNDFRSRGTRITLSVGRSVAVDMDEKESTARSVATVGVKCIVKDSKERREDATIGIMMYKVFLYPRARH